MAKIFFGCSMRGGYPQVKKESLKAIPRIIEGLKHEVVSKHQVQNWEKSEFRLKNADIHDRDYKWLTEANAGIFEISNPSLGVGSEISDMIHLGKPVLCLYKKSIKKEISAYILGKENSRFIKTPFKSDSYASNEDLKKKIKKFLTNLG